MGPEPKEHRQVIGFELSQGDVNFQVGQNGSQESEGNPRKKMLDVMIAHQSKGGVGGTKWDPAGEHSDCPLQFTAA